MNWDAYATSSILSPGATVEVSRFLLENEQPTTPAVGDRLAIQFPNNTRAGSDVQSASPPTITINVNGSSQVWEQKGKHQVEASGRLLLFYIVK